MKCQRLFVTGLVAAMALAMSSLPGRCDDIATAGRGLAAKVQSGIVTAQVTFKVTVSYQGESPSSSEHKNEVTALIIDPSGLGVMSLAMSSPEGMLEASEEMKVSTDLTDLKILTPDGKQIPYTVVLRDKDLDLAFIRPVQKLAQPMPYVDLANSEKVGMLDQVYVVDRTTKSTGRQVSTTIERVEAVMEKPRTFYIFQTNAIGAPVFTLTGAPVGVVLVRSVPLADNYTPTLVVLPAEDIMEAAKQAPAGATASTTVSSTAAPATPAKK